MLNELDRFHLSMDEVDLLPQTSDRGLALKRQLKEKLLDYKQYIRSNGRDLLKISN